MNLEPISAAALNTPSRRSPERAQPVIKDARPSHLRGDSEKENQGYQKVYHGSSYSQPLALLSPMSTRERRVDVRSSDTVSDPDLPSSTTSSLRHHQTLPAIRSLSAPELRPQGNADGASPGSTRTRRMAENLKCRLKLAMYKTQCHKEEAHYLALVPSAPKRRKIGAPARPATSTKAMMRQ